MRLLSIKISGFKSISQEHPICLDFCEYTVLIGANGAGKSNLVSFFLMLNYMMNGKLGLFVERTGSSQSLLHYGSKKTRDIHGEILFDNGPQDIQYSFDLTYAAPDRLILTGEAVLTTEKSSGKTKQSVLQPVDFQSTALLHHKAPWAKNLRITMSNCRVFQFHDTSASGPLRQSSLVDTARYLQTGGGNLASFLYLLREEYPDSYRRIESAVREVCPQFGTFYLVPNTKGYVALNWYDKDDLDYVLSVSQFSDGTLRFIALASTLLQPNDTMPSVIILDEPELGLHPSAISLLAYMLKEASQNAQIIVATQSTGLLDLFEPNSVCVMELKQETKSTVAQRLRDDELEDWLEEYTLSELWEKNLIGGRPQ